MLRNIFVSSAILLLTGCGDETASNTTTPQRTNPAPVEDKAETQSLSSLPISFHDAVPSSENTKTAFKMIHIPGDKGEGIEPFYIAETEVTWGMFEHWMYCEDLFEKVPIDQIYALQEKNLRPSPLYGDMALFLLVPEKQRPAISMSWRTAQAYCLWLSEQTGRTYRLPTDQEWMHVFHLSGGLPKTQGALADQAVLADTGGYNDEIAEPYFNEYVTRPVKSKQPNKLGIYDLLGNAAEWVEPTDKTRWVRGGHFELKSEDLTDHWRSVEDQDIWNATYPNFPVSRFWYTDHYYQGLRLVCEADSIDPK